MGEGRGCGEIEYTYISYIFLFHCGRAECQTLHRTARQLIAPLWHALVRYDVVEELTPTGEPRHKKRMLATEDATRLGRRNDF